MALNLNYIIADYEKNNKCDFCFRENKCKSIIVQSAIDPILIKRYGYGDIEKQHANRDLQQLLELVENDGFEFLDVLLGNNIWSDRLKYKIDYFNIAAA